MSYPIIATNYGQYEISGATLKAVLDTITFNNPTAAASGAAIHIVPSGGNQVTVIKTDTA